MIDVKNIVKERKNLIARRLLDYPENHVRLAIIQVGDNAASDSYIRGKLKDCAEVGILGKLYKYSQNVSPKEILSLVRKLNEDVKCNGIIVQLPLPEQFTEKDIEQITYEISPHKDVDGFRIDSCFLPCTPKGILTILDNVCPNGLEGKVACVIGRSKIVGRPLVNLLIDRGCTVVNCNSHTTKLDWWMENSDIIVSAVGKANFLSLKNEVHWKDKIVIDVGINRDENGKLCGDCNKELYDVVDLITTVPGGVGLTTRLSLLENLIAFL